LGTKNVEKNSIFAQYVQVQQRRAIATEKAIELRDLQHTFKEKEQHIEEMKYEDKILKMDIVEMCPKDRALYGLLQDKIRSRYRQTSSSIDYSTFLD